MTESHYLLSLKFIRETELDLEKALRTDTSVLEQYERLIAALAELDADVRMPSISDNPQISKPQLSKPQGANAINIKLVPDEAQGSPSASCRSEA